MSQVAGIDDPWGIPEGQTFEQAFNANFARLQPDGSMAPAPTEGGDGGGEKEQPYDYNTDPDTMRMREQLAASQRIREAEEQNRQNNAIATMKGLMEQYNLMSLYDTIVGYVKAGYDPESISVLIRTTPEYKKRFPAMDALGAKGRAISEGAYIEYEQTAANLERRYGLPSGMLMGNVTDLLTNEVSASELNDRVMLASAAAIQAPKELKSTFKNYYGIEEGGLAAYFLDPKVATPLLQKQAASALIGMEAGNQTVDLNRSTAEQLQDLGISQEQAREGFGQVAGAKGLGTGRGDTASQDDLIQGTLAGNAGAVQKTQRAAQGRLGRFQGGGDFLQTQDGVTGLGSAATR